VAAEKHCGLFEKLVSPWHVVCLVQERSVSEKLAEAATEAKQTRQSIADFSADIQQLASTIHDVTTSVMSSSREVAQLKLSLSRADA
jgi:hypothetical protein